MSQVQPAAEPVTNPAVALEKAQRAMSCFSSAWTEMARGVMAAGVAQIKVAQSMYAPDQTDWARALHPGNASETAHKALQNTKSKFFTALQEVRRINDELANTVFHAADSVVQGLGTDTAAVPTPEAAPAPKPQAAKPVRHVEAAA